MRSTARPTRGWIGRAISSDAGPAQGTGTGSTSSRLIEHGDEVVVTYEATRTDGSRFRNTEVLAFDGEKIAKTEVYFGWAFD